MVIQVKLPKKETLIKIAKSIILLLGYCLSCVILRFAQSLGEFMSSGALFILVYALGLLFVCKNLSEKTGEKTKKFFALDLTVFAVAFAVTVASAVLIFIPNVTYEIARVHHVAVRCTAAVSAVFAVASFCLALKRGRKFYGLAVAFGTVFAYIIKQIEILSHLYPTYEYGEFVLRGIVFSGVVFVAVSIISFFLIRSKYCLRPETVGKVPGKDEWNGNNIILKKLYLYWWRQ
ncbi:MAG: hypothetical protein LBR54_04865 [Oscillospiraceae bacterium]|jgi:F0F1-type ATP synthase membrane subunit a|nr:hypothetical protein [Oscillospiraceae bacterium]